jgi:hypothetical protein
MKPFQTYIAELNRPHEFRIKMANVDPKTVLEQIKNALDTYQLESISAIKSLPVQEHREFPNWGGPCECWQFDVTVAYPANTVQIAQVVRERAQINPDWLCVRNLHEAEYTDEAEAPNADAKKGALLDQTELGGSTEGQSLVGQTRIGSLLKELESRKFDAEGKDTNADKVFVSKKGQTTNAIPQGNIDPVGSRRNKIPDPTKG